MIESDARRIVVVAAPGTGKTRTIVERMIRLLREDPARVISLVTFTRTSRRDTDKKLRDAVGQKALDIGEDTFPRISTLHAFAKAIVHRYASFFGRETDFAVLVPTRESIIIAGDVVEDLGLKITPADLRAALARYRSTGTWPNHLLPREELGAALEAFDGYLKFYNAFDMEGLVSAACLVLETTDTATPPILLQVDEYQDLNPRDQELVRLASSSNTSRVVVVGDDAQSIYGFRFAHLEGIRELWESEDWKSVSLPDCHRLPSHILRASNSLIRDRGYLGGEVNIPADDGRRLTTWQCTRHNLQTRAVANSVKGLLATAKKSDGTALTYRDFMVLCPSRNHVNQAADLLAKCGVPIRHAGSGIPDDVWSLLLVFRILGRSDSLAFRQWLPMVGLAPREIYQLRRDALQANEPLLDYCKSLTDKRVSMIFDGLDKLSASLREPTELVAALASFPGLALTGEVEAVTADILQFAPSAGRMALAIYERYGVLDAPGESDDNTDEDGVLVTTMHGAKGLEAEFVYILWLNEGLFPSSSRNVMEEERVFYVALTRARQDAILAFHERWDADRRRYLRAEAMSPFVKAIGAHLEIRRVTAGDLK